MALMGAYLGQPLPTGWCAIGEIGLGGEVRAVPHIEQRVAQADDPNQAKIDFINRQAMGRLAQPEEIALFGVYLASDESAFVTGGLHLIDGGWTL